MLMLVLLLLGASAVAINLVYVVYIPTCDSVGTEWP